MADILGNIFGALFSEPLTAGEIKTGLAALQAFPIHDVEKALNEKLMNLPDDFVALEDIAGLLAEVGVPYAGDVKFALKVMAWVAANGTQAEPGSLPHLPSGRRGSDPWLPS